MNPGMEKMMKIRDVAKIIKTTEVTEGAGVTVHRSIGTPALRNFDPFVMLDHFGSNDPDQYIAGFPDHPHRGFNTFTYMLEGNMLHRDSMGNEGNLISGAAQWMKAASGVIHSEMPQQKEGMMSGFQLWINLPASEKMSEPAYQEYPPASFPVVQQADKKVKVLLGQYDDVSGPITDPHTKVSYFDVTLEPLVRFEHELKKEFTAFVYIFEGTIRIGDKLIDTHSFVALGPGEQVVIEADDNGARFILVAGQPIGEPIIQYGPFVMNTREEVMQAMAEYNDGTLVQHKAEMIDG